MSPQELTILIHNTLPAWLLPRVNAIEESGPHYGQKVVVVRISLPAWTYLFFGTIHEWATRKLEDKIYSVDPSRLTLYFVKIT